jgi:hypothetical protein
LTTEAAWRPDRKTGQIPTDGELARYQRVRQIMHEILQANGLANLAEDGVRVTGLKGPLEKGWLRKVASFAETIAIVEARREAWRRVHSVVDSQLVPEVAAGTRSMNVSATQGWIVIGLLGWIALMVTRPSSTRRERGTPG